MKPNHKSAIRSGSLLLILMMIFQLNSFGKCVYKNPLQIKTQEIGNMLTWATAEEQDIAFFSIEKSIDGINFRKIGDIKGAGYSNKVTKYRFIDFCLPESRSYYRLVHLAKDGSFTTSATFYLEQSAQNQVRILAATSTLTNEQLDLTLDSKINSSVIYEVKNAGGQIVFSGTKELKFGKNELSINCLAFQNGKYDVVLRTATERDNITIHKVDQSKVPNVEFVVVD